MALLSVHGCEFWSLPRHFSSLIRPPQTVLAIWIEGRDGARRNKEKVCGALWKIYVSKEMEIYLSEKLGSCAEGRMICEWKNLCESRHSNQGQRIISRLSDLKSSKAVWNHHRRWNISLESQWICGATRSTLACAFVSRRTEKNER